MAVTLWAPGACVSHRAAAALWEFDGFPPGPIELAIAGSRKAPAQWVTLHRTSHLDHVDVTSIGPLRMTSPTRTLADLCGISSREAIEPALDGALRRGLTTLPRMRWTSRRLGGRGRPGARLLAELLAERGRGWVPPESRLESRLRAAVRNAGLPEPSPQHEIRDQGRVLARVDFAYPNAKLAIEADGYRFHAGRVAWQRDRTRNNALTSRGWRVLHVTWDDLAMRPNEVVAEIELALKVRSSRRQRT